MAKKAKLNLKDLNKHEAFVEAVDPLEDILLEAAIESNVEFDEGRIEAFAVTAQQFAEYRLQYDQLKTRRLDKNNDPDRAYAHNRLYELDDEYKARVEKMKSAHGYLHGEQADGKKRPPHYNGAISIEEQTIWEEFKEARIDKFIDVFNDLVAKALKNIPEDILELFESDEALWNNKKGA